MVHITAEEKARESLSSLGYGYKALPNGRILVKVERDDVVTLIAILHGEGYSVMVCDKNGKVHGGEGD